MKVVFDTIKEIRILNKHKTTVENLTKFEAISSQPSLFWCNGVLFSLAVNPSEFRAVKQFEGIEIIDELTYAFSEKIERSSWNGYAIEVRDSSEDPVCIAITEALMEAKIHV